MKKLICILVSIFLLIPMCVGCAQDGYTDDSTKDVTDTPEVTTEDMTDTPEVTTEDMTDTSGAATEDVTEPDVTEPDVTEPDVSIQLPPCYGENIETESFNGFDEFLDRLHALEKENAAKIGDVKLSNMLRDIEGLEHLGYCDVDDVVPWITWVGGLDYTLNFRRDGGWPFTFVPLYTETDLKALQTQMYQLAGASGDILLTNGNVTNGIATNISPKMPLETEIGTAYEYTYDTKNKVGQKLQCFEYTDTSNNITYMLAKTPSGSLLSVYNGENSFFVYTKDPNLTISAATKLSSVPVK